MPVIEERFIDFIDQTVSQWPVRRERTWHERQYSDALLDHIGRHVRFADAARSRMVGVRRADLYLVKRNDGTVGLFPARDPKWSVVQPEEAVAVEVKLDLRQRREMLRLEAQMRDYLKAISPSDRLIVLLLGQTRPEYVRALRAQEEETRCDDARYRNSRRMRVIELTF